MPKAPASSHLQPSSRQRLRRQIVGAISVALLAITALRASIELVLQPTPNPSLGLALVVAALLGVGGVAWWAGCGHGKQGSKPSDALTRTDHHVASYREPAQRRASREHDGPAPDARLRRQPANSWLWFGLATVVACCGLLNSGSSDRRVRWTFLEPTSAQALGFAIPEPSAGGWEVMPDGEATGGSALVNHPGGSGEAAAMALAPSISTANLHAKTRCRFGGAQSAEGCGIVFRYTDKDSYSLVRLDAGGVAFARVVQGSEQLVKRVPADVRADTWYELALSAEGRDIVIRCNGIETLSAQDDHWRTPGSVGLWVPSEGRAWFDELAVEPTGASVDPLTLVVLGQKRT